LVKLEIHVQIKTELLNENIGRKNKRKVPLPCMQLPLSIPIEFVLEPMVLLVHFLDVLLMQQDENH
jgi:hypothetical protein